MCVCLCEKEIEKRERRRRKFVAFILLPMKSRVAAYPSLQANGPLVFFKVKSKKLFIFEKLQQQHQQQHTQGVNFINVFCAHFLYERRFSSFSPVTCT